jgi:hypothetical protein
MKKGLKLHSFVSVILGCSLAIIEQTKKKLKNTHKWMNNGSKERENLPQMDEKWSKTSFLR